MFRLKALVALRPARWKLHEEPGSVAARSSHRLSNSQDNSETDDSVTTQDLSSPDDHVLDGRPMIRPLVLVAAYARVPLTISVRRRLTPRKHSAYEAPLVSWFSRVMV